MKRKHYSDSEIVEAILMNDKDALSFLYENNFESLNNKIILEGGYRKDTEDIFHDAFVILYLKIKNNDLKLTCSIHTFLQAIARNLWKRRISNVPQFFKMVDTPDAVADEAIDEELVYIERRKIYLKHLADMPNDCRRLIKMVIEGLNLLQIREQMPYNSLEFTKTKRFRCKVMLIKRIIHDPLYNELRNERIRTTGSIPRW